MKPQVTALVVDDERLARKEVITMLQDHPEVLVVGEADSVESAAEAVSRLDPDLIFLDIQMPGPSGFDLLERIETRARVIFVTAHDQFALRAFEVNALDYLLKPVSPGRLARALARARAGAIELPARPRRLAHDDRLFLMLGNRYRFLKVSSIVAIHAAGDYTDIHLTEGANGLVLRSMKEWESLLPPQYFVRIHRSTIINMDYVERIEELSNCTLGVRLKGVAESLLISRRCALRLKSRLG
jgi:two-component system LytT family response regulator